MQGTQVVTSDETGEAVFRWKEGMWARAIRWAPDRSGLFYESGVANASATFVAVADLEKATFIPAEALEALEQVGRIPRMLEDNERRSTTFFAVPNLAAGSGSDLPMLCGNALPPFVYGTLGWQLMHRHSELVMALGNTNLTDEERREIRYGALAMYEFARCVALSGGR